ncbi:peptide ABC transporter substrate-binding protein [Sporolactobacillus nakayamae]|uniref:Oligopeptide transport system substrate-binding protein n=1 Tax=Sporolactobacillus nakayamae TaxID=269670 RepID=A0A1I2UTN1_9BACL|nr:peptide ABC transporter substrate-binding protein [Sporolactobacillus nakayamae]SFG79147.1 oligopeptide transport system substrate-binding protein [Sporolactobacillus nakayamae]
MLSKVKKTMELLLFSVIGVSIILSLVACSSSNGEDKINSETLKLQQPTSIDSLDPALSYDTSSTIVVGNVNEGLYTVSPNNKPQLAMAEKVTKKDNGKTLIYTIRKDAKWSNGAPVTASDFVFAWRRVVDPKLASGFSFELSEAQIKNADAIIAGKKDPKTLGVYAEGEKTLVLKLNRPVPFMSSLLSFASFAPINEKFYKAQGKKFSMTSKNLIYNGPYVIKNWKNGDNSITLAKNQNYYNKKNVKVKKIELKLISDTQRAVMAYKNGDVDYAALTGNLVNQNKSSKDFRTDIGAFNWYLMFNSKIKGLDNKDLRKAIAYSIDSKELTQKILKDGSVPAESVVPKGFAYSPTDHKDFADQTNNPYSYNPNLAKKYWNKAKKETNLRSFTLIYGKDEDNMGNVAAYIKSQIEKTLPDLNVNLQTMLKKTRLAKMQNFTYQVALTRWAPDYADPTAILSMYTTNMVSNYGAWSDKTFDSLYNQANTIFVNKSEVRWNALIKAENILMDSATSVPLYQTANAYLLNSKVHNFINHSCGVPLFFKYVYIK